MDQTQKLIFLGSWSYKPLWRNGGVQLDMKIDQILRHKSIDWVREQDSPIFLPPSVMIFMVN
jgi:hypothetical protein